MAKQLASKWRESASLIIAAKNKPLSHPDFDYKVLLFNRAEKSSFMPCYSVFPGGVYESADNSSLWLKHFSNFGIGIDLLKPLTHVQGPRPNMYNKKTDNCLPKEISLRLTAIRETFEEVGVLLCRNRHSAKDNNNGYGRFRENFDRAHWQRLVHNDPNQFLALCQKLDIVPDLWSLHEWSAWLTPSTFKKRFQTAFYTVMLQEIPNLLPEENEVTNCTWKSPLEYLRAHLDKKLLLPPPQIYELARLCEIQEVSALKEFASERAKNGTALLLPVHYKCSDGGVSLLPGDDMYPSDPNSASTDIETQLTVKEFRDNAKRLHRWEWWNQDDIVLHVNFNLSDGHLNPNVINGVSLKELFHKS